MRSEMALQSVLFDSENNMSKLSMYKSKSKKIKMDYCCQGRYENLYMVYLLSPLKTADFRLFDGIL